MVGYLAEKGVFTGPIRVGQSSSKGLAFDNFVRGDIRNSLMFS